MLRFWKKKQTHNRQPTPPTAHRQIRLDIKDRSEAMTGVTIQQVKEILTGDDLSQTVRLFDLMVQRDLHLSGALSQRRDQMQTLPYKIEGAPQEVALAEDYLKQIGLGTLLQDLSSALVYGFSAQDLVWEPMTLDNKAAIAPRPTLLSPRYFAYDHSKPSDRQGLYYTQNEKKRYLGTLDRRKILLHLHRTETEQIERYSPLYKAAWFVALKHQVIASNMQWFDSLGVPPLIIATDTADAKVLDDVLYQALSLRSNAVGIFPKEVDAKLLTEGVGSKADFLSFIHYIDEQVSFFITGQTLATGSGSTGSYAQAKEHANRLYEKLSLDARLYAATLTALLNQIIAANLSAPKGVTLRFTVKKKGDKKEDSEVVKNLTESGYEIPTAYIEEQFGIKGVTKAPAKESNHTTEHNRRVRTHAPSDNTQTKPLDRVSAAIVNSDLKQVEEALTQRLLQAIQEADSYEEAYALLVEDEQIDMEMLEKLLSRMIANAQLAGLGDAV